MITRIVNTLSSLVVPPWLKIGIKALPYAAIIALAIALAVTRATLHDCRMAAKLVEQTAKAEVAEQVATNEKKQREAVESYASRIEGIHPVILHNKEVIREYANTPAGSAPCLSSSRVSGINDTRAELFGPAKASTPEVRTDASPE